MKKTSLKALIIILVLTQTAHAEITIEQLIEQSGIKEADTAMRELPRWSNIRKIVVRGHAIDIDLAKREHDDIEFVSVRSSREAVREARDADAYIGNCDAEFVAAAERLIWLQRTGSGVETCVDIPGISNGKVILTNLQKMESPIIAEHAIAMMLSLTRGLPVFIRAMDEGQWQRRSQMRSKMTSVVGKRLLVVGLGGIGTEVARFGSALGMSVYATRNSERSGPRFVDYVGLSDELNDLATEADVIVSALPLTDATRNLFDAAFFSTLKPSAIFINVGRGGSVVTNDLLAALQSGELAGAGLDVTEPEPLPADHALWTLSNVIITPHISSGGSQRERRAVLLRENLRRFIAGDALLNVVDPERGY